MSIDELEALRLGGGLIDPTMPNPRFLTIPLSLLVLGQALPAQSVTTTLPAAPQGGIQDTRLWNRGSTPARVQYAIEEVELQSAGVNDPMLISKLRWKAGSSGGAGTYANVTVRMSTMASPAAGFGYDFAANHGPNQAIVYQGPVAVAATSGASNTPYVEIQLRQLFHHVPADGPLLIDVQHDGTGWSGSIGAMPSVTVQNQMTIRFAMLLHAGTGMPGANGTTRLFGVGANIEVEHAPLRGVGYAIVSRTLNGIPRPLPPVPPAGIWYTAVEQLSGGGYALRSDGQIVGYGNRSSTPPPALPAGRRYVQMAATSSHGLAVRDDGTIAVWGSNTYGQLMVPSLPPGVTWVSVATDRYAALGLRSDGRILGWGDASLQQTSVPALPAGVVYTSLAAGNLKVRALRSDGNIASWGSTSGGLGAHLPPSLPQGLRYTAITDHDMALRSDGQLVHWWTVVTPPALPPNVYYTALGSCGSSSFATRSDGVTVAWDLNTPEMEPLDLPPTLSYLQVDENQNSEVGLLVGPRTRYDRIGSGCPGSLPAAELIPANTPRIGRRFEARLFQLPIGAALLTTGFSTVTSSFGTLPIALAPFGMPGCSYFVSPDIALFVFGQNQQAMVQMDLPNTSGLIGVRFSQQALVLDGNAGNPAGAVVSSAATGVIGG